MFIINLYRFLIGYVEILVFGEFAEKLLNQLSSANIVIWDIKNDKGRLSLKISIKNFLNLRKLRGKNKIRIKIVRKFGLIFIIKRYIKRAGIPLGIILFFTTLFILSQFIWNISVVGNDRISSSNVLSLCEKLGVREGMLSSNLNTQILREKLLLEAKELSWCSFNVEGSKLTLNVTEVNDSRNSDASNIVSDYDCVINEILVELGVAEVQKGDAVKKGDILVSGISEVSGVNRFVHARAVVNAEITETVKLSADFSREKRSHTGKTLKKSVLQIFGIKIPLFLGGIVNEHESSLYSKNLYFIGEKLPISLHTRNFEFLKTEVITMSRSELLNELTAKIEKQISEKSDNVQVLSRHITENKKGISVEYDIKYNKNIGINKNLIFDISK